MEALKLTEEEVSQLDAFRASVSNFTKLATDKTRVAALVSYIACKCPMPKDKAKAYVNDFLDRIDDEDLSETVVKVVRQPAIPEDDEETIEDIIEEADTVDVTYLNEI